MSNSQPHCPDDTGLSHGTSPPRPHRGHLPADLGHSRTGAVPQRDPRLLQGCPRCVWGRRGLSPIRALPCGIHTLCPFPSSPAPALRHHQQNVLRQHPCECPHGLPWVGRASVPGVGDIWAVWGEGVTSTQFLLSPQAWLTEIHEYAQKDVVIMLLGNKVHAWPGPASPCAVPSPTCRPHDRTGLWGSLPGFPRHGGDPKVLGGLREAVLPAASGGQHGAECRVRDVPGMGAPPLGCCCTGCPARSWIHIPRSRVPNCVPRCLLGSQMLLHTQIPSGSWVFPWEQSAPWNLEWCWVPDVPRVLNAPYPRCHQASNAQ